MIDLRSYVIDKNSAAMLKKIEPFVKKRLENSVAAWTPSITNEEHHSKKMISSSQLKFLMHNDLKSFFKMYISREVEFLPNDQQCAAFAFGTCAHLAVLEPREFQRRVFSCGLDKRTKAYSAWCREKFGTDALQRNEKSGGYRVLGRKDEIFLLGAAEYAKCEGYIKAIENHSYLNECFKLGTRETSGYARCPLTGLDLMIRTDLQGRYGNGEGFILDPKTSQFESIQDIKNSLGNYNYDLQQAFYLYVANLISDYNEEKPFVDFGFVFLKKSEMGGVFHIELEEKEKQSAFQNFAKLLIRTAYCIYFETFPPYDGGHVIKVSLPPYIQQKRMEHFSYIDNSLGF